MSGDDLEFRISRIKLEPGDVLVFKTPHAITAQAASSMREAMMHAFPGVRALILDQGMELAIVKESDLEKLARVPA